MVTTIMTPMVPYNDRWITPVMSREQMAAHRGETATNQKHSEDRANHNPRDYSCGPEW